jgi:hypothetical protein
VAVTAYTERLPARNCRQNARWMAERHGELSIVEGYLVVTDRDGREYRTEHTWNETPDGQLVDSTAWTFKVTLPYRYERDPEAWVRVTGRGPSGGQAGAAWALSPALHEQYPELVREIFMAGRHPRAGHDRGRWASAVWQDYRAPDGIAAAAGPWTVAVAESPGGVDEWAAQAVDMPWLPGRYTVLEHRERGLVMSDMPAEIAGCLPFMDAAAAIPAARLLIAGLGLGIVPAWLLRHGDVARIDVVEIDAGIIALHRGAPWAADPRLHVHDGDAHTWQPGPGQEWDAAWYDIWDTICPGNLPSMRRLHRRFARRAGWALSWERPECGAMARRAAAGGEAAAGVARLSDGALLVLAHQAEPARDAVWDACRAELAARAGRPVQGST